MLTVVAFILLAIIGWALQDDIVELIGDNQVEIGQAVGVTRASDLRQQRGEE